MQLLLQLVSILALSVVFVSANEPPLYRSSLGSSDCSDVVKACAEKPISQSDLDGINACSKSANVAICLTTISAPFYTCVCRYGFMGDKCEQACQTVETSTSSTTITSSPVATPKIFVVGGYSSDGSEKTVKTVEAYDFQTAKWSAMASLPTERGLGAAAVNVKKLYAIGGHSSVPLETVDVYDPITNSWTSSPSMSTKRDNMPGVGVLDGKIYVMGGYDGSSSQSSVEVFDSPSGKWTIVGRGMNTKRNDFAVGVLNGNLYAVGGWSDDEAQSLKTVEKMNPSSGLWTFVTPMNTERHFHTVAALNGKLYAIGGFKVPGYVQLKSVEVYDPISDRWSQIPDLSIQRSYAGAVTYNGLIYVVGGYSGSEYLDSTEIYNPTTNTWTILEARMSTPRSAAGVVLL